MSEEIKNVSEQAAAPTPKAGKKKKVKKERKYRISWYTYFLLFVDLCAIICFGLFYGPYDEFRQWYTTTAISSGKHKYLAYVFYGKEDINRTMCANRTSESGENTDTSQIHVVDNPDDGYYENEFDRQVLEREPGDVYKVIELKEKGVEGWIIAIYDPSRVQLATADRAWGATAGEYTKKYSPLVLVNGGGDYRFKDNGDLYAFGGQILNGKITKDPGKTKYVIGMTNDNILYLAKTTMSKAQKAGCKWATTYGPFLIVNGNKVKFTGNGGYGIRPRTAIGQRKDGIILLCVMNSNGYGPRGGCSMPQLADTMEKYGAYNAANLDGGGSTALYVNGELINDPAGFGYVGERYVGEFIIVK